MAAVFELDGETFDVDVVSLEREFTHGAKKAEVLLDGTVHYEPENVYCHYSMTVRAKPGREEELDRLWDQLLLPMIHDCSLPYGSDRISQSMYVTGGKQALIYNRQGKSCWGDLTLQLIAAEPRRSL